MTTTALTCPACRVVVLPDVVALSDIHFGHTWLGDRKKWTSSAFGLLHECDPARRSYVLARDPRPVAHPPWTRFLFRHSWLSWAAAKVPDVDFLPVFHLDHHQTTTAPGEGAS